MVPSVRRLKRSAVDFYWNMRGPLLAMPAVPAEPRSVLFVCKGNICRSPFAEHLASQLQRETGRPGILFASAGLHVRKPIHSPEQAIRVARQFGVNLESHRSRAISKDLVETHDMIIAMEAWQYSELQSSFKQHYDKFFLLPLLDSAGAAVEQGYAAFNIQDPYGGPSRAFEICFERIRRIIQGLVLRGSL